MTKQVWLWTAATIFVAGAWVMAQKPELTARELFYRATKAPTKAVTSATAPKPTSTTPTKSAGTQPASGQPSTPAPQPVKGAQVIQASFTPLGLRYSLKKRIAEGQYDEVDVDTAFRSGDSIRLTVESTDDAYLYIANLGSSGAWNPLFPSTKFDNGNNHIQAHQRYDIPPGGQFTFDNSTGDEKLFVVLSRDPESDIEKLIYTLNGPAGQPSGKNQAVLTVQAINDDVITKIRSSLVSRDLIFEKVNDQTSARKERAAYVVNATGAGGGRVIKDLVLTHR